MRIKQSFKKYIRFLPAILAAFFLTYLIYKFFCCMDMWYIPLEYVDSANRLEDYFLWQFSVYMAVFCIPLWFLAARKVVRLFREDPRWLTFSAVIPRKITIVTALVLTGWTIWQIQRAYFYNNWQCEVPEYAQAAAISHQTQALIGGLMLIYVLCLFRKQRKLAYMQKVTSQSQEGK